MAKRKYVKENNLVKAINTDSLELQKPLVNEYYDINIHNSNMDKIDLGYKQNKNDISDIKNELSKTENTKYTTANGVKEFSCKDGYVDNVVIEGKTLVNIGKTITKNVGNDAIRTRFEGNGDDYRSRYSNNTFTLINYTDKVISFPTMSKDNTSWSTQYDVQPNSRIAVQIPNDASLVGVDYWNINGWTLSNDTVINDSFFAVLEGDHTDKPISYFEGLKSVGQGDKIEVLSRKEDGNLFDVQAIYNTQEVQSTYKWYVFKGKPNTNYTISSSLDKNARVNMFFKITNYDYTQTLAWLCHTSIANVADYKTFTTDSQGRIGIAFSNVSDVSMFTTLSSFSIYEGTTPKPYTPYQSDKKQILTTLRSLPNGVKDTIEKRGNKYYKIKRCVECNPREITYFGGKETYYQIELKISDLPQIANNSIISNLFGNFGNTGGSKDTVFIHPTYEKTIVIQTTNPSITTKELAQTYIENNNFTVVYELATPIIEELPNFNPQTFSDKTTLLLNSGVVQAEASFEVTNSLGSELEVLKGKVSDLDDSISDRPITKYELIPLNGWSKFYGSSYITRNGDVFNINIGIQSGTTTTGTILFHINNPSFIPKVNQVIFAGDDVTGGKIYELVVRTNGTITVGSKCTFVNKMFITGSYNLE